MLSAWSLVGAILTIFGLPLVGVGLVLSLCEWSWQKRRGSLGSTWLLGVGGLLCLPMLVYLAPVVWVR